MNPEQTSITLQTNARRMRRIRRCNNFQTLTDEDVAQHSYYVTLLAWNIAIEYNTYVAEHNKQYHHYDDENTLERVDVNEVIQKSLCHDLPEALTSDIPYSVKHANEKTNEAIKSVEGKLLENEMFTNDFGKLLKDNIVTAKQGLSGEIVAIADMLELSMYAAEEVGMGNIYMAQMVETCVDLLRKFPLFETLYLKQASPTYVRLHNCVTGSGNNCFIKINERLFCHYVINDFYHGDNNCLECSGYKECERYARQHNE